MAVKDYRFKIMSVSGRWTNDTMRVVAKDEETARKKAEKDPGLMKNETIGELFAVCG